MTYKLIEKAETEGTPLVDGDRAIFVWQGKNPPGLTGDFNDWEEKTPVEFQRVAAQVWSLTLSLPRDAYIEYAYRVNGEQIPDPYNRRLVYNGLGEWNNYFYMPEGAPNPLTQRLKDIPHGAVTAYRVPTWEYAAGRQRTIYLYQPPTREACPLLVVYDGGDYLRKAKMANIVDNLIAQGSIQPVAMAMVQNGGKARAVEYACNEATLAFLRYQVLPLAKKKLKLIPAGRKPGAYAVLGASLGGLMALYTAVRLPKIFGKVISQSASLYFPGSESVVFDLIRNGDKKNLSFWMDAGVFEALAVSNRAMVDLLAQKGYPVAYSEYHGGHNYTSWGSQIGAGLEAFFGVKS